MEASYGSSTSRAWIAFQESPLDHLFFLISPPSGGLLHDMTAVKKAENGFSAKELVLAFILHKLSIYPKFVLYSA
jgi:hypothetical protein